MAQAPEIAETYNDVIGALYASGARKFLFLGVPPTDRTPLMRSFGPNATEMVAANVDRWNFALSTYVHDVLTQTFPEAKYVLFDTVPFFNALLDDGFNYCFTETAGACPDYIPQRNNPLVNLPSCPWPFAQYFWADDYHPTWRVHQYLAQALAFVRQPVCSVSKLSSWLTPRSLSLSLSPWPCLSLSVSLSPFLSPSPSLPLTHTRSLCLPVGSSSAQKAPLQQ